MDLSLVPADDLKAEFERRYPAGLVLCSRTRDAQRGELYFMFWGDPFTVAGLLSVGAERVRLDAARMIEDCEED